MSLANYYKDVLGWLSDGEAEALYSYAIKSPVNRILELGTFCGKSTVVLAQAMAERSGIVITIDRFPTNQPYKTDSQSLVVPNPKEEFTKNLNRYGLAGNVVSIQGEIPAIVSKMTGEFGLIYVDADHNIEGLIQQYTRVWPMLSSGGFMIFHDYGHKQWPEVILFVDLICERIKRKPLTTGTLLIVQK